MLIIQNTLTSSEITGAFKEQRFHRQNKRFWCFLLLSILISDFSLIVEVMKDSTIKAFVAILSSFHGFIDTREHFKTMNKLSMAHGRDNSNQFRFFSNF